MYKVVLRDAVGKELATWRFKSYKKAIEHINNELALDVVTINPKGVAGICYTTLDERKSYILTYD